MRKLLLALSAVLVLASFTSNPNKTTILKDIDGTLLQSFPVIEQVNGEYTVTFTVDAMTVVTSNTDTEGTNINLVENGTSGITTTYSLKVTKSVGFINYQESNFDIASGENMYAESLVKKVKPPRILF